MILFSNQFTLIICQLTAPKCSDFVFSLFLFTQYHPQDFPPSFPSTLLKVVSVNLCSVLTRDQQATLLSCYLILATHLGYISSSQMNLLSAL